MLLATFDGNSSATTFKLSKKHFRGHGVLVTKFVFFTVHL